MTKAEYILHKMAEFVGGPDSINADPPPPPKQDTKLKDKVPASVPFQQTDAGKEAKKNNPPMDVNNALNSRETKLDKIKMDRLKKLQEPPPKSKLELEQEEKKRNEERTKMILEMENKKAEKKFLERKTNPGGALAPEKRHQKSHDKTASDNKETYYMANQEKINKAVGIMKEAGFWDGVKDFGAGVMDYVVHPTLDVAGMVPVLGAVPDLINAGAYGLRGDYQNMAISGAAAVPVAGLVATPAKYTAKTIKAVNTVNKTNKNVKNVAKQTSNTIQQIQKQKKNIEKIKPGIVNRPIANVTKNTQKLVEKINPKYTSLGNPNYRGRQYMTDFGMDLSKKMQSKYPQLGNISAKFNKAYNPTFMPKLRKGVHRFGTGWKGWRMAERYDPTGFLNDEGFGKSGKDPFMYQSVIKPFAVNQFNAGKDFLKNRQEHGWQIDKNLPKVDTETTFKPNDSGDVVPVKPNNADVKKQDTKIVKEKSPREKNEENLKELMQKIEKQQK